MLVLSTSLVTRATLQHPPEQPTKMDEFSQIESLQKELYMLNADMRRARKAMEAALLDMQRIEDKKEELEQLISRKMSAYYDTASKERLALERDLMGAKRELALQEEETVRKLQESDLHANSLKMQMNDMEFGLAKERNLISMLQQELSCQHNQVGYPVVGLELSEGEPYDIAGVWVVSVVKGGPADMAGIRKGDVISEVAGISTVTRDSFRRVIFGHDGQAPAKPGHQLSFRIHREDELTSKPVTMTVMLTLGWSARKPEGRRSITVTRTDKPSPTRHTLSTSPSRRLATYNTKDKSISPTRQRESRFL
eukprot:TRINITY_DN9053_c0_g1_i1.p1 TRINITY_DN9053_c0_g1~~TRINITY_DN9053_c0_g1_i1.p1  ORF type:complete len:310 (+),score=49.79 TRINITY_DN9053_c0_g1_i1:906-1835(+)